MKATDIEVNKVFETRGFKPTHTGGGCYAWQADYDDEKQWYVVVSDDLSLPTDPDSDTIIITLYDRNGDSFGDRVGTLADVIDFFEWEAREIIAEFEGEV